mmetsp:Transcript_125/g.303  ORF Transcript_125/g.303 Transcript_125/m.303 type:complete len:565 (-) Transcript_125:257-1951(-)|eukprot:CAMPEP_0118945184 /NCGR_PEP_ID=MMETSP1169-20130426/41773_1 /TAXON_ID=36882 /ORGANISM="Pyramimonas obovata, Strain CCMP722" /LENGTH=564 /DNA_ID=CAMNT_0006890839 /DNA_START=72 /DNA_END=1766 /DNA_ORIENTATION=-
MHVASGVLRRNARTAHPRRHEDLHRQRAAARAFPRPHPLVVSHIRLPRRTAGLSTPPGLTPASTNWALRSSSNGGTEPQTEDTHAPTTDTAEPAAPAGLKLPSAYGILSGLICAIAALTWIVPAGAYDTQFSAAIGKDVPVPGSYHRVAASPQGLAAVFLAPVTGMYAVVDVIVFLFMIGGFLNVVNKTGAIDAGVARVVRALKGREIMMIPCMMFLFALGGTSWGLAEETIPFYSILTPVMLAAGYDAVTAVATVLLGAGVGVLGSTVNPFMTVIASEAAGVGFTSGLELRVVCGVGGFLVAAHHVITYAMRVKSNPELSVVADLKQQHREHFLGAPKEGEAEAELTRSQGVTLVLFAVTFAVMIWGVALNGWDMAKMGALFLAGSVAVGVVNKVEEETLTDQLLDGAKDMLGVAILIGLARGIVVVMGDGQITDTILQWMAGMLQSLGSIAFVNVMFVIEGLLSFLVPSTSGLAALTMPVMAPLADFANVSRPLLVTAYQCGAGLVNLVTPTSGVVMGALAIGRIPYTSWLKFMVPLVAKLAVMCVGILCFGVVTDGKMVAA